VTASAPWCSAFGHAESTVSTCAATCAEHAWTLAEVLAALDTAGLGDEARAFLADRFPTDDDKEEAS